MIRCYRILTNSKYRLIVNFLIPIGIGILALIGEHFLGMLMGIFGFVIIACAETVGDYFGFGGICKKGALGMELLKTAHDGTKYLGKAILMDILVRPFRIAIYVFIAGIPYMQKGGSINVIVLAILILACLSVVSLNVLRYSDVLQINYFVAMVFSMLATVGLVLAHEFVSKPIVLLIVLAVVLSVALALTYYHTEMRIETSFRDE